MSPENTIDQERLNDFQAAILNIVQKNIPFKFWTITTPNGVDIQGFSVPGINRFYFPDGGSSSHYEINQMIAKNKETQQKGLDEIGLSFENRKSSVAINNMAAFEDEKNHKRWISLTALTLQGISVEQFPQVFPGWSIIQTQ